VIRTPVIRTTFVAILLLLAALPIGMRPAAAQDATAPASGETELAPQLPAVDLPTMNEMSYTFEIDSAWDGSGNTPAELPVYQFTGKTYTEDEVKAIADTLKIGGDVSSQGEGTYTVTGDGSLYTTPGMLQYVSGAKVDESAKVPSDQEAIAAGREWLRTTGLSPANIGDGEIVARIDNPARRIVGFKPSNPSPLLSSTPGITVTVGPGGTIVEGRLAWADIAEGDTYRLRGQDDAFSMVASRQSYLDVTLPEDQFPQGTVVKGKASYDQVAIAWTTSGVQGETQYLQPVYVFSGTFTPAEGDGSWDITAYVPAIVTGLQPVG
jgi:hypothetical protein